eukprot:871725-Pleurochrysis_carterae.AAC.1
MRSWSSWSRPVACRVGKTVARVPLPHAATLYPGGQRTGAMCLPVSRRVTADARVAMALAMM